MNHQDAGNCRGDSHIGEITVGDVALVHCPDVGNLRGLEHQCISVRIGIQNKLITDGRASAGHVLHSDRGSQILLHLGLHGTGNQIRRTARVKGNYQSDGTRGIIGAAGLRAASASGRRCGGRGGLIAAAAC